jgi:pimeloyl-ACP methyl ester carboxylesterase
MLTLALAALVLAGLGFAVIYWVYPEALARWSVHALRHHSRLSEHSNSIPGFRIAYLEGGHGEPMVLLHGIGADKDNFTPVSRFLTGRYRVLIPDLPGFGHSERPAEASYTIAEQVERVRQWLDVMGLDRVHLGGSSMGGWIAAGLAATYPERVRSLWLLAPAGVMSAEPSEMLQRLAAGERPPLFAEKAADFDAVLDFVLSKRPFLPGPVKRALARRATEDYKLHNRIFQQILQPIANPLDTLAERIEAPTLVVWGELDRALHVSGAGILGRLINRAEVQQLPHIGHLPMLEAPKVVAHRYVHFLTHQPVAVAATA